MDSHDSTPAGCDFSPNPSAQTDAVDSAVASTVAEGHSTERRVARRSSLMFRAAKLLCESGEYVCIIRDISATGARLRLFHAAPHEQHLFLELSNGERFAMERMWQRDDQVGFRFSCSIDVADFIREASPFARRPIRLRLRRPALVAIDGLHRPVTLRDISQHGAAIDCNGPIPVGQMLRLEIDGLPPRFGCVRWRSGSAHGLVFQQAYTLDELAMHALTLQPLAPPRPAEAATDGDLARCA
jgi:hypothetical protein